jgi:hypothetical protein
MRRYTAALAVLAIAFSVSAAAQQKPLTAAEKAAAEKAAAEQQAGVEAMAKMAAQQAEAVARAQQKVAEESQRRALEAARADAEKMNVVVPLDLEVVISRYQGDKKTSSLPYALTVNAKYVGDVEGAPTTSLRMGGEVPLPTMSLTLDGKPIPGIPTGGPVLYKAVGRTSMPGRGFSTADASKSGYRCRTTQSRRRRASAQGPRQTACPSSGRSAPATTLCSAMVRRVSSPPPPIVLPAKR